MSGSSSSSFKEDIHGWVLHSVMENFGLRIWAAPDSHGSIRMVKEPGNRLGGETGAMGGEKVRRNEVSPLRAFTVKDMSRNKEKRMKKWCEP